MLLICYFTELSSDGLLVTQPETLLADWFI